LPTWQKKKYWKANCVNRDCERSLHQPEWGGKKGRRGTPFHGHVSDDLATRFNETWGSKMMWRKKAVAVKVYLYKNDMCIKANNPITE
jgi:hypothetical protein